MEADLVNRAGLAFQAIPAAGLHGVGLRALPGNLLELARGYFASLALMRRLKPDAFFFTGGYVAVPMALASFRRPQLAFVPDIQPGLALRAISRLSDVVAVTAEESVRDYPARKRVVVTGYPVRPELVPQDKQPARKALGLDPAVPAVLVFGGSLGARSINQALWACLAELLQSTQIIHLTGSLDWPRVQALRESLPESIRGRYLAHEYLHEEMARALAAADLVVSRAGASALGEYPHFGLPAVLVPYPHAWRYQQVNAKYLAGHGAALVLPDERLKDDLLSTVIELLGDAKRLAAMAEAMRALDRPGAAQAVADEIVRLAEAGLA